MASFVWYLRSLSSIEDLYRNDCLSPFVYPNFFAGEAKKTDHFHVLYLFEKIFMKRKR